MITCQSVSSVLALMVGPRIYTRGQRGVQTAEDDRTPEARHLFAQVAALDEIVALLLADHLHRTADPIDSLRMLSNRLSRKLAEAGTSSDRQMLSDIEQNFDRIIAAAREVLQ